MPITNPLTTPSQPCDYCLSQFRDEDDVVVTNPADVETPYALEPGLPHRQRRTLSVDATPHSNSSVNALHSTTASADAAVGEGLELRRAGGPGVSGAEPPSPSIRRKASGDRYAGRPDVSAAGMRPRRKSKEVTISNKSPEIMATQQSIKEYRAILARDLETKARGPDFENLENVRVSPIREDSSRPRSPNSNLPTTSTESNKTIREGTTPGLAARTPSYPFPRMNSSRFQLSHIQNSSSPFGGQVLHDQLISDPSTPASAMTFLPPGCAPCAENPLYPSPNLYELSLMLSAEPGLNGWWDTVVQIMTELYKAERISLSVPADATDVDNVPWGQKATYNPQMEDGLSMGYMSSSIAPNTADDKLGISSAAEPTPRSESPARPSLQTRHSFTVYEENKEARRVQPGEKADSPPSRRPGYSSRSKSHYPGAGLGGLDAPHMALNQQALEEHDAVEDQRPLPNWEATIEPERALKGRVLPVLQALDLEADPLLDHNGIMKVIERGKVIALTRTYPYLDPDANEQLLKAQSPRPLSQEVKGKSSTQQVRSESSTNLSSLLASASAPFARSKGKKSTRLDKSKVTHLYSVLDDGPPRPPTPRYEEFEQAPPSPWSQSPAPSPAVRPDPSENPFFTDSELDEGSFNPGPSPHDYTSVQPPETIGVDNSWTVLHIPLNHILLSRSPQRFKLDPSVLEQRTNLRAKHDAIPSPWSVSEESARKHQQPPIAILSILSSVIPYPSNLRYSLEHLAPHLATSFSLCRHYSNLETEIMGLSRKRPSNTGFGAVGPDGRPVANLNALGQLGLSPSDDITQRSIAGSLTSPSDYSTQSRSVPGSPMGTPLWESGSFGLVVERRVAGTSPGPAGGDSYFNPKPKGVVHTETPSGTSSHRVARKPKEIISHRQRQGSASLRKQPPDSVSTKDPHVSEAVVGHSTTNEGAMLNSVTQQRPVSKDSVLTPGTKDEHHVVPDSNDYPKRLSGASSTAQNTRKHTKLHSYGGDFAASFQSLPPSTPLLTKPTTSLSGRPGSIPSTQVSMNPPTDRLKGLMLDLLPVQVFVAWPVTGEIVWVNSRYLTYRGQTLADLIADPWATFHEEDREDYLRTWTHSLRTGEQFVHTVRLRRFDGAYRWHQARAVASRDKRGVIVQFIGSYMDIHDQKVAEFMALRQAEVEASEAKHRLLANLIPQIIFTGTESDGITFANEQWLAYTGQEEDGHLGNGFMDFVHPDDLARCRAPVDRGARSMIEKQRDNVFSTITPDPGHSAASEGQSPISSSKPLLARSQDKSPAYSPVSNFYNTDLSELARKGIIKITTDSNGRLSYTTELRLRSKAGEYRWHLIRCVEIDGVGFGSGPSSYFGSATDINDHKLLEAKLKEAMESKGRFLSNMSHEIRTPLIGISGMVSFLQDTTLSEEQRDFTNTIQTSANSLLMIINDILDLSKVDAGMMKLKFEWFHTRSLIEDVNELVSTMAIAKRLELNYIVEENVPSWVKGDKFRIRQVLLNVIGNAIKFTSEGEVFSRCRVSTDGAGELGENQIMLEYSVIDTGRGFSEDEAGLIFKPFSQIDGSSTRQHGGSGLGLVISRQLVELHGGRMEGSAVLGKGSTFTFTSRFDLPSADDHPDMTSTPPLIAAAQPQEEEDNAMQAIRPLILHSSLGESITASPSSDPEFPSPSFASPASSDPSVRSVRTQNTTTSSVSSVHVGLARFSEAAKASGQDLSQMRFDMPAGGLSLQVVPTPDVVNSHSSLGRSRLPMYSILVICPQKYSREAITKHVETTLPKDVPRQITALSRVSEAQVLIGGSEPARFTHVIVNLSSAEEIVNVTNQIAISSRGKTITVIMSDSVQRQAVLELASTTGYPQLLTDKHILFVHKPVKPSRFAVIFDPARERDVSTDLNRSSAAQMVESQKQSYLDVEKRIGDKSVKVLLVEDNPVNQKVLSRYLQKVGTEAEIAADGMEATEKVFAHPAHYYSLILCDLHMPRKDGYQTCREVRQWEQENNYSPIPIIALSANVMSDVQEKCLAAGFNDFVTKPVDFVDLSTSMSKYF
ncbi:hsp90-like protein [Nemania sp. NC0429]|nr:hsp90-like protein [Nemania sp. NC0429]